MGMTIDEAINAMEYAVEVMQKYQKIERIVTEYVNNDFVGMSDYWIARVKEVLEDFNSAIKALAQEPILDKIYADIQRLRGCSCSCSDGIIDGVEDILDKYKAESEGKE